LRTGGADQASVGKVAEGVDTIADLELVDVSYKDHLPVGEDRVELQPPRNRIATQ
jgi:hypothetical protein